MELKYYLRGLGLGIIVTAIIMAVVSSGSREMTDAEVIRRAKQLGMTEEKVLSDSAAKKEEAGEDASADEEEQQQENKNTVNAQTPADRNAQNTQTQTPVQAQVQTQTKPEVEIVNTDSDESEGPEASEVGENVELERQEAEETNTSLPVSDEPMIVTIGSGDGSYAASRKLADIGAISSPENFDTFLCENGYDKKIRPGTYTIPADASDEQMARIITGAE